MQKTSRERLRKPLGLLLVVLGTLAYVLGATSGASGQSDSSKMLAREIDQLAVLESRPPDNGWLILNSRARRAYQVFRSAQGAAAVWSIDLDTLQPIRRVELPGFELMDATDPRRASPEVITQGFTSGRAGEVLHAVDEEGVRLFFVGLRRGENLASVQPSFQNFERTVSIGVIDGAKLDAGDSGFVRYLPVPATQLAQLRGRIPLGLTFVGSGAGGKLLIMFGSPGDTFGAGESLRVRNVYDHWLAQWDAETGAGDWVYPLDVCQRASVQSNSSEPPSWALQLPILRMPSAIYLPCQATHGVAQVVKIHLLPNGSPDLTRPSEAFPMPRVYINALADPGSQRLFFQVSSGGLSWWTFDGRTGKWAGATGMPQNTTSSAGLDPTNGKLYALVSDGVVVSGGGERTPVQGGLIAMEGRLSPPGQFDPVLSSLAYHGIFKIVIDPAAPGRERRLFVRRGYRASPTRWVYPDTQNPSDSPVENFYRVIEDPTPPAQQPLSVLETLDGRTIDREEDPEVTGGEFEGNATAFGARVLLIGGVTAATSRELEGQTTVCYEVDREVVVGSVDNAQLSDNTASARSVALHADEGTKADLAQPTTRCPPREGDEVPQSELIDALLSQQSDVDDWDQDGDGKSDFVAECAGDDQPEPATASRKAREFEAEAFCRYSEESVEGSSSGTLSLAGGNVPAIKIASASSSVRIHRDVDSGTVVTVEAITRGIEIAGVGSIDVVRTTAKSFAHGRPVSATTEFTRIICGVRLVNLVREPCGDVGPVVNALNRALGRNGEARLRQPDPDYEAGSEKGYMAAIRRDQTHAFEDEIFNKDTSKAVPGLEIIFYRGDDGEKGPGRQIFQFAAVEASSAYGVSCLFGPSPSGSDPCIVPTSELGVFLTDEAGNPLPGGVFEVHVDEDSDGVLGVDDPLLVLGSSNATCTTAEDGIGNCAFTLPPGDYVVHETAPPSGYAAAPDCVVSLPQWASQTCSFENLQSIATIDISLTDDSSPPVPLGGAVFELFADDGDQKLGPLDLKLVSCRTDSQGACVFRSEDIQVESGAEIAPVCLPGVTETVSESEFCVAVGQKGRTKAPAGKETNQSPSEGKVLRVPLGSYVIHQAGAPAGYLPAEDEPISLMQSGDEAHARFVNGLKGEPAVPAVAGGGGEAIVTTIIIEEGSPALVPTVATVPLEPEEPQAPIPALIPALIRAPARLLLFLLRHPKEAALIGAMWLLLIAPAWVAWRRRSLSLLEGVGL